MEDESEKQAPPTKSTKKGSDRKEEKKLRQEKLVKAKNAKKQPKDVKGNIKKAKKQAKDIK